METTPCKKCPAQIIWAKSPVGSNLPLDAEKRAPGFVPAKGQVVYQIKDHGDFVLNAVVVPAADVDQLIVEGVDLYVSHFTTCPDAPFFSRQSRAREGVQQGFASLTSSTRWRSRCSPKATAPAPTPARAAPRSGSTATRRAASC